MRRGLVFTLFTVYVLALILSVYTAFVIVPRMPPYRTYSSALQDAALYWWASEYNAQPISNNILAGGCILVPQIRPYNDNLPDGHIYDDLNTIAPLILTRRCA